MAWSCGRDGGYMRSQQHGLIVNNTAASECLMCQQQRPMLSSQYNIIPQRNHPGHWSSPILKELVTPSYKDNTYSRYEFSFPTHRASARTTIQGLLKCLSHGHSIPHSIISDQVTWFRAKVQVWTYMFYGPMYGPMYSMDLCILWSIPWTYGHVFYSSYHMPHHPDAARLIECQNDLIKGQLKYKLSLSVCFVCIYLFVRITNQKC